MERSNGYFEGQASIIQFIVLPKLNILQEALKCHGDPQQAPQELLEQYGDTNAFHESEGDIRALISIRVPLDDQIRAAHQIFIRLSTGTGLLLLLFFAVVSLFVVQIERHQLIIEKQNEELSRLATVDMLTGIYNRQGFAAIMRQKMASGKRHDFSLSLIMMDLDFFKRINDTYGHGIGDEVLTAVGKLLSEVTRASDIVGRWGGEEFVIACTHTEPDGAVKLAEKVLARLAALDFPQGIKMTASFGVAPFHPQDSLKEFVCRTDKALYRSKENGRNQVSLESLES